MRGLRRLRPRRPIGAAILVSTALAAGLVTALPAAAATAAPDPAAAASPGVPPTAPTGSGPSPETVTSAETRAIAEAKRTGKPVPVPELMTETDDVVANPSGTLSLTRRAEPVRVQQGTVWRDLDATLVSDGTGAVRPKVSTTDLVLSGGGTGPMAVMDDRGSKLAFTWPTALPAPQLAGDTAVYANVLPDVDLKVTAATSGAFSHVLVVKTAAAAKNPQLATLKLATQTSGVTLGEDAGGNLRAVDAAGDPVFQAPAPKMWDSSRASTAPTAAKSAAEAQDGTQITVTSSEDGPGSGAQVAPLEAQVGSGTITLTPHQGMLTSPETRFPVYIDPTWIPVSRGSSAWTYVQSAWPDTSHYKEAADTLGVGYQGWETRTGTEIAYWQVDVSPFPVGDGRNLTGKVINKATLTAKEVYSADWSCTNQHPLTLKLTDGIGAGTTWDTRPPARDTWGSRTAGGSFNPDKGTQNCGELPVEFNVLDDIRERAHWPNVTVSLEGSTSRDGFKRFSRDTRLTVEYNSVPNTPTNLNADPAPTNASGTALQGCAGAEAGFLGITNPATGGIHLRAKLTDPDNTLVRGHFSVSRDYDGGPVVASGTSAWVNSGTTVDVAVGQLESGRTYWWSVQSDDDLSRSAWAPSCRFTVDGTAPTNLAVTSTDFPVAGGGKKSNENGAFTLSATDAGTGVKKFEYSLGGTLSVGGDNDSVTATNNKATLTLKPSVWGTNTLTVQAVDAAGNRSAVYNYIFYVPANPVASTYGDITNDGFPDLLVADGAGDLWMHQIGGATPGRTKASDTANSPLAPGQETGTGAGWTGVQTSHRGGNGSTADDLFVHRNEAPKLYIYQNSVNAGGLGANGNLYFTTTNVGEVDRKPARNCVDPCVYNSADWSDVEQILAIGDATGDGRPDLITVERGTDGTRRLWLFPGSSLVGQVKNPILLGTGGWENYTLIAPGDVTNDALPDLWARNRDTGILYQYPNSKTTVDGVVTVTPESLGAISTRTQIGTGFAPAAYATLSSEGDFNADGKADLWGLATTDGSLVRLMGQTPSGGNQFGAPITISASSWTTCETISGQQLCGPILAKYRSLSTATQTAFGAPVTGVLATADGRSKYVNFTNNASIHWTPQHGTYFANGAVRTRWGATGWGTGPLGYPKSDEYAVAGGMRSDFDNGYIRWTASTNVAADHTYTDGETSAAHLTVTGDFNGDGRTDLATVHDYQGGAAALWTSLTTDTGGASKPFESWKVSAGNWWITSAKWVAGDFNNDGRDDIAAFYKYGDGRVKLHSFTARADGGFNNSVGSWEQATGWDWARTTLMAGNTDGTGADELVAVQGTADGRFATYTVTAKTDGTFNAPTKGFEETHAGWWYTSQSHFALGDANNDGRADIIGTYIYDDNTLKTFTSLANTNGTFPGFTIAGWASGANAWWHNAMQVTAGDADGDGRADLVVMYDYGSGDMGLWTFPAAINGNLNTPLASVRTTTGWWAFRSVPHAGDVNADGRDDLITLYRLANGGFIRYQFTAQTSGGFSKESNAWYAPPGTW
ncbi:FG-GAP-like repeat-containing protein [Streptodolium elevatio]